MMILCHGDNEHISLSLSLMEVAKMAVMDEIKTAVTVHNALSRLLEAANFRS